MGATAGQEAELSTGQAPVRLFLAVRRTRHIIGAAFAVGVLTATFGGVEVTLPTAFQQSDVPPIPMWRMLALVAATLPVLALDSQLADLEVVSTHRLRHWQRRYLGGMAVVCAVLHLGTSAITVRPLFLAIMARSWLAWTGLALIAGAWFGWRLAWVGPTAAVVILWYWGVDSDGYVWWEFSAQPPDHIPALLLSLGLLGTGLLAYWATPWRRQRLAFRRSRRRRAV